MKLLTLPVAVAAMGMSMCAMAQSAQAREHHRHYVHHREAGSHHFSRHYASRLRHRYVAQEENVYGGQGYAYSDRSAYHGGAGPRPAAWCGWEMRQLVGSDPGPSFNLARNWARWGHAGPAGVGAVVVWSHHVGRIVGQDGGQWVIESGNDGHRLRTRPRSIAGAIAIRWG